MRRLIEWFDCRVGVASFMRRGLNHIFPDHWSFMLGEIGLYAFAVLVATGIFMAMFFNASGAEVEYHGRYEALQDVKMSAAYRSALDLSFDVPAGLFIRQTHHWAALIFVVAIVAHLARIFFTGAFRRPRELNWVIGITLLALTMFNGFTGYSVVDDLLSGAGLLIAYSLALSIPFIGGWVAFLIFGGRVPTTEMIPRLYGLHITVVPALIAALISVHVAIVWRQLHTNYRGAGRSNTQIAGSRLWPVYATKALGLFLLVAAGLSALGGLVQINPIWIYGPFDPTAILPGAQPDWYLGWNEGALRLFPGVNLQFWGRLIPEVFFPGVLLPILIFVVLYAYPFIEAWLTGENAEQHVLQLPWEMPGRTALGFAAFAGLFILFVAGGQDVLAVVFGQPLELMRRILRILVVAVPICAAVIAYVVCLAIQTIRRTPG